MALILFFCGRDYNYLRAKKYDVAIDKIFRNDSYKVENQFPT